MGHWHDVRSDLRGPGRHLRDHIPEVYRGFAELSAASLADGVISATMKEVIALTISVAEQCDGCIAAHARAAVKRGASPQQVAEALGVAIMMGGGPATVYAPPRLGGVSGVSGGGVGACGPAFRLPPSARARGKPPARL
jgi:AhpD family alkylhydroperoxidase